MKERSVLMVREFKLHGYPDVVSIKKRKFGETPYSVFAVLQKYFQLK
jgi:hypothetical protein